MATSHIRICERKGFVAANRGIAEADILKPGVRFYKAPSRRPRLFGGWHDSPAQTLEVTAVSESDVAFVMNGTTGSMARKLFVQLARSTLRAGAEFNPAEKCPT